MGQYFWWITKSFYKKRLNYVFLLAIPILILIVAIVMKFVIEGGSIEVYKTYSFYFLGTILGINSVAYYVIFYNRIKKNTSETSLEILSYSTNQSRAKIYLHKFLAFFILNIIGALISLLVLIISFLIILNGRHFAEVLTMSFAYFGTSLFLSLLFFGLFFLIDTFLMTKITKRHSVFNVIIGIIFAISVIAPSIVQTFGTLSVFDKKWELEREVGTLRTDNYNLLTKNGEKAKFNLGRWNANSSHIKLELNTETAAAAAQSQALNRKISGLNQISDFYRDLNIVRYFNTFNFFPEVMNLNTISNQYPFQDKGIVDSVNDFSVPYYYSKNNLPSEVLDSLFKIKVKLNSNDEVGDYYLNIKSNGSYLFLNLPNEIFIPWASSTYSSGVYADHIVKFKFNDLKTALNAVIDDLKKDSDFTPNELVVNQKLIIKILNKLQNNSIAVNLMPQSDWDLLKEKMSNDWELSGKQDAIIEMVKSWIIYVLLEFSLSESKTLNIDFDHVSKKTGELKDGEEIRNSNQLSDFEKIFSHSTILQMTSESLVSFKNTSAIGVEKSYYHLWISIFLVFIFAILFNVGAFYRYRKIDIA
ncbi:hypothetical protein ACW95P_02155 [Candidatus Mycoplasma pogonae]